MYLCVIWMIFLQVCFISLFDLVREVFIRCCGLSNWIGAFFFCNSFSTAFTICFKGRVTDIKWCVLSIVILSIVITGSNVLNFVCVIFKIFTTTDSAWCYIVISCFIVAVSKVIPPSNVLNLLSRFRVYIWWNFEPVSFLFRCFDHFSELAWFLVCLYILSICGCTIFNCSVNIPTFLKFERSLSQANVSETSNILRGRRYMYSLTLQLFSLHSIHSTKRLCGTCCFTVS